jgi:hypothetical protein
MVKGTVEPRRKALTAAKRAPGVAELLFKPVVRGGLVVEE